VPHTTSFFLFKRYEAVYFDVAQHLLSEASTAYSAYQFFNSKETIAAFMQQLLNSYFTAHLHASVVSLQIQSCHLPAEFNAAITDTVLCHECHAATTDTGTLVGGWRRSSFEDCLAF
jgi:hypothetical protein